MGIGFFDVCKRIEREFDVSLGVDAIESLKSNVKFHGWCDSIDPTAGEVHTWVCETLRQAGRAKPEDAWPRIQQIIAEVAGTTIDEVGADLRVIRDIGID